MMQNVQILDAEDIIAALRIKRSRGEIRIGGPGFLSDLEAFPRGERDLDQEFSMQKHPQNCSVFSAQALLPKYSGGNILRPSLAPPYKLR
jgi:hypothetical protein